MNQPSLFQPGPEVDVPERLNDLWTRATPHERQRRRAEAKA